MKSGLFLFAAGAAALSLPAALPPVPPGYPPVDAPIHAADLSPTRSEALLNGVWAFQPAEGPASSAPTDDWGLVRVPASWAGDRFDRNITSGVLAEGTGGAWRGFNTKRNSPTVRTWYERPITIPESWTQGRLWLEADRVSTDAKVWLDDTEIGEIAWPGGRLDLTPHVRPGETYRLRMLVVSQPDAGEKVTFMDHFDIQKSKARLPGRGLLGDVKLIRLPAGPRVAAARLRSRLEPARLFLDLQTTGNPPEGARVELLATDPGGRDTRFPARPISGTVEWTWPEPPRLWSPESPVLYDVEVRLLDPAGDVLDVFPVTTGIREVELAGRRVLLNGVPLRARAFTNMFRQRTRAQIESELRLHRDLGFNLIQLWPSDPVERGSMAQPEWLLEAADRLGMLVTGVLPNFHTYIWKDPSKTREDFEPETKRILWDLGNHPSLILWATTPNSYGHNDDQDPRFLGRRDWIPADDPTLSRNSRPVAVEWIDRIRDWDPSRPVFTHHGTYVGDIHTLNWYPNFTPIQEQVEALSEWAHTGDMPFLAVEYDGPTSHSFHRGRAGHSQADKTEPLITEWAASRLGPGVYTNEPAAYRESYVESLTDTPHEHRFRGSEEFIHDGDTAQRVVADSLQRTLPAFRAFGALGVIPWAQRFGWEDREVEVEWTPGQAGEFRTPDTLRGALPSPVRAILEEINRPVHLFIGGDPVFTDVSGNVRPGETVDLQAVVLNDRMDAVSIHGAWALTRGTETLDEGRISMDVPAGDTGFAPINFTLPRELEPGPAEVRVKAHADGEVLESTFPLLVMNPTNPPAERNGFVYDPGGALSPLLHELGVNLAETAPGAPAAGPFLILGPDAFAHHPPAGLEAYVRNGGRLWIQSPDADTLHALGFRTGALATRRFWPVGSLSGHPVIDGLDPRALRDWRGAATSRDPYPESLGTDIPRSPRGYPVHGWRWGNNGVVSSHPVEKTSRSGWTPLLQGGFDLAYSPLMELRYGKGLVVLSTLDLTGRIPARHFHQPAGDPTVIEPAALELAGRLLAYLADPKEEVETGAVGILGGGAAEAYADAMGWTRGGTPVWTLVGPDAGLNADELDRRLRNGDRLLFLPRTPAQLARLGLSSAPGEFGAPTPVPDWPELSGVSAAEFRLRAGTPIHAVQAADGWDVAADGFIARRKVEDGVALILQLTPEDLDAKRKTYLHYSEFRLARIWAQISANLGAAFAADSLIFSAPSAGFKPLDLSRDWEFVVGTALPQRGPMQPSHSYTAPAAGQPPSPPESGWTTMPVAGFWEQFPIPYDGATWVRRDVGIDDPAAYSRLLLGRVDDGDRVWINGVEIGATPPDDDSWQRERDYPLPAGVLRKGDNRIAIRVFDTFGDGGFTGEAGQMRLEGTNGASLPLAGGWRFRIERRLPPAPHVRGRLEDPGIAPRASEWMNADIDETDWRPIQLPGLFETALSQVDGLVWLRKRFDADTAPSDAELELRLGRIDDFDIAWLNGVEIGRSGPEGRNQERIYPVPPDLLRAEGNELLLRVFDQKQHGGFASEPDTLKLALPGLLELPDPYWPGFITDFPIGDDPYRYYRW